MKNKAELEKDILAITLRIHEEFPELSKFIDEMPDNFKETDDESVEIKSLFEYYKSLEELISDYSKTHPTQKEVEVEAEVEPGYEVSADAEKAKADKNKEELPGYPSYGASEDIYAKSKEESEINPENILKKKAPNEEENTPNEKGFENHMSGDDLDVPGSELDDQQEDIGSEDEENNYYSLGGDNHNDLEEDKG